MSESQVGKKVKTVDQGDEVGCVEVAAETPREKEAALCHKKKGEIYCKGTR